MFNFLCIEKEIFPHFLGVKFYRSKLKNEISVDAFSHILKKHVHIFKLEKKNYFYFLRILKYMDIFLFL